MCTLTMTVPIGSRRMAHPFASANVGAAAGSCQLAASPPFASTQETLIASAERSRWRYRSASSSATRKRSGMGCVACPPIRWRAGRADGPGGDLRTRRRPDAGHFNNVLRRSWTGFSRHNRQL
jgi:hypothetical protein